jgi:hypothetical protein
MRTRGGVHGKARCFERAGCLLSHPHFRVAYTRIFAGRTQVNPCYHWLMIDFPDETLRRERALCREELARAQQRYRDTRNSETLAACLQALKRFADLVVDQKLPEDFTTRDVT